MKFRKINGKQFIILEDNDKVYLTIDVNLGGKRIIITTDKDKIGDLTLVNSIYAQGMLEKVYASLIVSSEEIISKYDKWLEMFKQVHDVFRELVLSKGYRR